MLGVVLVLRVKLKYVYSVGRCYCFFKTMQNGCTVEA